MIAAAAGARVVAVDIDREKLGRARRLGAEAAVDARSGGVEAVLEATGGGAHVSLDALGSAGDLRGVGGVAAQARPPRPGRPHARPATAWRPSRWRA